MYDRIVVPTDGSPTAEAAIDHAVDLATRYDADVRVISVVNSRVYDTSIQSAVEPLREQGEAYVDRLETAATDAGVPVTTDVEIGRPGARILEYVDDHDVDLIVMGSRGRGGLPRRLLGSVTNYVVTHATVPVHVVPPADSDE
ncbi:MAG: universal stress protein [Haloarculaceae archaeon]